MAYTFGKFCAKMIYITFSAVIVLMEEVMVGYDHYRQGCPSKIWV